MPKKPAIFIDRDNTLTRDHGYTWDIADFAWIDGAVEALQLFTDAGLDIFIVTNQGGIGRGFFKLDDMHAFHDHLQSELAKTHITITDIAFCPHHPLAVIADLKTPCSCRKPEPGMILHLAEKWNIDLPQSIMIGDSEKDVEAGRNAGCHAYHFEGGNLASLARQILHQHFGDGDAQ
jgi:D-glycero-D-manno-heptose 1,7-bisphosphate phosphatase